VRRTGPSGDLKIGVYRRFDVAFHAHPEVKARLGKHPRFHLHFSPTSSSWLDLVERWFSELNTKMIRRGVFRSVDDLVTAIEEFLRLHNDDPKPRTRSCAPRQRSRFLPKSNAAESP
jgi:hypothetical protein